MYRSTNDFRVIAIILLEGLEIKIKKFYSDVYSWAYVMEIAAGKLHNENMTRAKKIHSEHFFKASATTEYKRLYSESEITKILNQFSTLGKLKKILEYTAHALQITEDLEKSVEYLKTIIKLFKLGTKMSLPIEQRRNNSKTAEEIERGMEESVKKFAALMEALRILNSLSPPGFKEYFEYAAGIFRGSQRLIKITKEYTQRLRAAGNEAEGIWTRVFKNKNSIYNLSLKERHTK